MNEKKIKKIVKDSYSEIAKKGSFSCCDQQNSVDIAKSIGYSEEEIAIAAKANFGLGCGNPTAIANIQQKLTPAKAPPDKGTKPVVKQATKAEISALYNKGVGYFTSENYTQALKVFKQVLALDPNHAGAKDYKKRTEARLKVLKGGG